ncbi:protein lethal(2)k10201-like [Mizuhopecten yessoensis]|uniref:protein lethal(2)k10201-like n=1 Tax=Mizuhopecten yessoensis TaxID=6573 RepID=UPI000B45846C|nr:protein lethal(2)k10201-like [Mizuhopecten yessoensis]
MFQCLVESCNSKFSTRKERKSHVVKVHKYPSNYRFDQEQNKLSARKEGKQSVEMEVKLAGEEQVNLKAKAKAPGTEGVDRMEIKGSSPQRRQFSYKWVHFRNIWFLSYPAQMT